jgi:putative ABC transport system permease protein
MSWLVSFIQRLRSLGSRRQLDRDLEDELAAHLALKQAHLENEGLTADQASRQARLALGNSTSWKENTREQWSFSSAESLWRDIVFGTRVLLKDRIFTVVALVTLAIGIGANAAVFSVMNALLWRSLPVRDPQQLVRVRVTNIPPTDRMWINGRATVVKERRQIPFQLYQALGKQDLFNGVFGVAGEGRVVADVGGVAYQVDMRTVTGTYFQVLGVEPSTGRLLGPSDDVPGAPATGWSLVISDSMWSRVFQRKPDVVGTRITLERVPFTIVGVVSPRFHGVSPGADPDVWLPLSAFEIMYPKWHWRSDASQWMLETVARLKPGQGIDAAHAKIGAMSRQLLEIVKPPGLGAKDEKYFLAMKLDLVSARSGYSYLEETFGPALQILMAAVAAVLLIAATNLTNLILARSTARRKEIAVRLALGASGARVRRQLLVESMLLVVSGSALGVVMARWLAASLVNSVSPSSPIQLDTAIDWNVLGYLAIVLGAVVLIAGWIPAWSAVRGAIHEGTKQQASSKPATYFRSSLIVIQIALSLALLGGAGLLLVSLRSLLGEATGFDTAHTVFLTPDLFNAGISREKMPASYATLLEETRRLPGVRSAAWTMHMPLSGGLQAYTIQVPSRPALSLKERFVFGHQVTDGYFAAAGIPLIAGHDLPPRGSSAPKGSVVSENLARRIFGSPQTALGQRLKPGGLDWTEIVGVASDAKFQNIKEPNPLTVYTSYWDQRTALGMTLLVNYASRPEPLIAALRLLFQKEAGRVPFLHVRTISENIWSSVATERILTSLLVAFAAFALVISATGIAGLLSYAVQLRRREIAIRIALGATPALIAGQLQRYGLGLAAGGMLLGGLLSFWLRRAIVAFLFRVDASNWAIWLSVCGLILLFAMAAGAFPARRAAKLDPMTVLRLD